MKIVPFVIPKTEHDSLIYQEDVGQELYEKLHQHKEIQISYIAEGEGTLVVGNSISPFSSGDVFVIGSFVPHVFKSTTEHLPSTLMKSIFFTTASFGVDFFNNAALEELNPLFEKISRGIRLKSSRIEIAQLFEIFKNASKLNQVVVFLTLLSEISSAEFDCLSSFVSEKKYSANEGERMRKVLEYTMKNYSDKITLNDISDVAVMTKNAFCKYFKKRTNITYFEFLKRIRIEHACSLLREKKEMSVAEIAQRTGYKNLSNFNQQFRDVINTSPQKFRNLY